jgi:hypothetical protein
LRRIDQTHQHLSPESKNAETCLFHQTLV